MTNKPERYGVAAGAIGLIATGTVAAALGVASVPQAQAGEAEAMAILKSMADYLVSQETLAFSFDSAIEVITPEMEKIGFDSSGEARLVRPDKLRAHRRGGYADVELFFDGSHISVRDIAGNAWAQIEAAGTIDDAVTLMRAGHGVSLPGADLLTSDVYEALTENVLEAKHVGLGVIDGRDCEHLAFRTLDTDWQIWVEADATPAPCKLVITSKTVGGAPQYTVRIRDWQAGLDIPDAAFTFEPPEDATELAADALIDLDELPPPAEQGDQP